MPLSASAKKRQAAILLEDFTGHPVEEIENLNLSAYDTFIEGGAVDAIEYTTVRDGKVERYRHEFSEAAAPIMAISHDGKITVLVGGAYQFTDRGFIDQK